MKHPIDSRLIYKILKKFKPGTSDQALYELLFLDRNSGASFRGSKDRISKSWWPKQVNWSYYRWEQLKFDDDCLFSNSQPFPLGNSDYAYSKTQIHEQFSKEERVTDDIKIRLTHDELLTFESYLFFVLDEAIRNSPTYGELTTIKEVCKSHSIPQKQLDTIEAIKKHEDLLEYLIMQAKAAEGSPLEIDEDRPSTAFSDSCKKTTHISFFLLRSILEGSQPNQPCWAEELCKSYGLPDIQIPSALCDCMTLKSFENDSDFLNTILPRNLLRVILPEADSSEGIADLMQGTHSDALRRTACEELQRSFSKDGPSYLVDDILKKCKSLNLSENQFFTVYETLFKILGDNGERLLRYQQRCQTPTYPYIGMAILIVYALLGEKYFYHMIPNETLVEKYFHQIRP